MFTRSISRGSTSPIPGRLSPSNHAEGWTYLEFSTEGEQQIPEEALMGSNFVCGFEGELCLLAGELWVTGPQVDEDQVVVRAAAGEFEPALGEDLG